MIYKHLWEIKAENADGSKCNFWTSGFSMRFLTKLEALKAMRGAEREEALVEKHNSTYIRKIFSVQKVSQP